MTKTRLLVWGGASAVVVLGAALALVCQPWLSPWWPGRHEAAALPDVCPALAGLPAPEMDKPGSLTLQSTDGMVDQGADCTWGTGTPGFPPLYARYVLYPRAGNHSGTDEAERASATQITRYNGPTHGFSLGADTPIAEVGDDARITVHGSIVDLVARKANVVLTLEYDSDGQDTADDEQAIVATDARTLLGTVTLS